jgi:hypothetical protein
MAKCYTAGTDPRDVLNMSRGRQRVVEGFRSHQWNLIVLLAHDDPVLDLASANPLRAYAVAAWRVAVKTS